jgi:peptidylprolyl isomerase
MLVSSMNVMALFLSAGIAGGALSDDTAAGAKPNTPAVAPAATPETPAATPETPAAPAPKPAPGDGMPVVNKSEVEGILIEDLKIGEGGEIKPGAAVVAHYHGTLKADGKVFDSSYERGEPAAFPLDGVIPGWQKGVPGMKIGGMRRLTIPAALGYGDRAVGSIPANSDLVFIVEIKDALVSEDIKVGEGEEIGPRPIVLAQQSIKTKDGAEVSATKPGQPYIWLPGELPGMDFGLKGMKVGGKRKINIPAAFNVTPPGLQVDRPGNVDITIEIEVVGVRNLVPPGQQPPGQPGR